MTQQRGHWLVGRRGDRLSLADRGRANTCRSWAGLEFRGGSCRPAVLVDDATRSWPAADRPVDRDHDGRVVVGRPLLQALTRTMLVEVRGVRLKQLPRVTLTVEQQPVSALLANAADEPFRIAVRPRRSCRRLDDLHALGGEHLVKGCGELRVPIADQEPERADPPPSSASRLRACCTVQPPVGCAVTPKMCTRRLATSITKNAYSRCSRTVSKQKKSVASSPARRNAGQLGSARRGAGPRPAQDPPDGSGADPVPEPGQLALDAAMSPRGVLPGQLDHQLADLLIDRWATRPARDTSTSS